MKSLEGVNCFKCEAEEVITPAEFIVEYFGIKTPLCKKCKEYLRLKEVKDE